MQSANGSSRTQPYGPTRILLIEDVAATVEVVKAYLDAAPGAVVVESVGSLGAALERIAKGAFDLIIADLNLPDSMGLETLDRLVQATDRLIIVLTIVDGPEIREAAIARGAYDFLQKNQLSRATLGQIVRLATIQAKTFRSVRESEARFRSLTELSSDFYWETDTCHRIIRTSHGPKHHAINARDSQIGKTRWEIPSIGPDVDGWKAHRATLDAHLPFRDFEISRSDAEGVERHLSISGEPVFDESGVFTGYRGVGRDITSRRQAEDHIRHLATRDALTGLPNRMLLSDRFSQMIAQAKRQGAQLAVLFIDLDGFKQVNDSLGHAAGDELLKEAARRLETAVRAGDTVARVSGDEFVIILGNLEQSDSAALVAQKIVEVLREPVQLAGKPVSVTASVGISLYPADGHNAEALLGAADAAMYRAKQSGRNAYQFFTASIS